MTMQLPELTPERREQLLAHQQRAEFYEDLKTRYGQDVAELYLQFLTMIYSIASDAEQVDDIIYLFKFLPSDPRPEPPVPHDGSSGRLFGGNQEI